VFRTNATKGPRFPRPFIRPLCAGALSAAAPRPTADRRGTNRPAPALPLRPRCFAATVGLPRRTTSNSVAPMVPLYAARIGGSWPRRLRKSRVRRVRRRHADTGERPAPKGYDCRPTRLCSIWNRGSAVASATRAVRRWYRSNGLRLNRATECGCQSRSSIGRRGYSRCPAKSAYGTLVREKIWATVSQKGKERPGEGRSLDAVHGRLPNRRMASLAAGGSGAALGRKT
jgi:hypothetical protein